jgi:hypothetical protein
MWPGVDSRQGQGFFLRYHVQTSSRIHPTLRSMSNGDSLLWGKMIIYLQLMWRLRMCETLPPGAPYILMVLYLAEGQLYSCLYGVHENILRCNSNRVGAGYIQGLLSLESLKNLGRVDAAMYKSLYHWTCRRIWDMSHWEYVKKNWNPKIRTKFENTFILLYYSWKPVTAFQIRHATQSSSRNRLFPLCLLHECSMWIRQDYSRMEPSVYRPSSCSQIRNNFELHCKKYKPLSRLTVWGELAAMVTLSAAAPDWAGPREHYSHLVVLHWDGVSEERQSSAQFRIL